MKEFLDEALAEAERGLASGGIPIGAVLVIDGEVVGRGHNQRVQRNSVVLHAEMAALENAGRRRAADYQRATMVTTLAPCDMCSGAILFYGIRRVVVGEDRTSNGAVTLLRSRGVEVEVADDERCVTLMERFVAEHPDLWAEDSAR